MLELRDLERGGPPQRSVHRFEPVAIEPLVEIVEDLVEHFGDSRHFLVRREVELRERARPELPRRAVHHGRAPRLAEDAQEFQRLAPNPPELPRLLHDERPAHDREDQEHEEDELRDRTRVPDERENAGTEWVSRHRRSLMFALSASQAL